MPIFAAYGSRMSCVYTVEFVVEKIRLLEVNYYSGKGVLFIASHCNMQFISYMK